MFQLNIDKDFDGTWCWSVWECDPDDYWYRAGKGVQRQAKGNYHSETEAIAEGVHALLTLGIRKRSAR